ncbi:hypothetical protein P691DRAFT_232001 [Macrolepiota fuliginosa MF-IS2]|uniref:Extracellular membrane protein CFEM domain-containing protein n=1 Tax=Macrolepiota fuliginosa MF-IS2 TaxID=1400762 RepID=A0A9P5X7N6_9AGAR|nr:hypothetical protein P691DRAFT_232001 [Macrolepiota fuliginosa MF-IS2]
MNARRRHTLRPFVLLFLLTSPTARVYAAADSDVGSTSNLSGDWARILGNDKGATPCQLQQWLESPQCDGGGGGSGTARRALHTRDGHPSNCTCTIPYFNLLCGCQLTTGPSVNANYSQWKNNCESDGLSINADTSWMSGTGQDIPSWASTAPNNGTFNMAVVRQMYRLVALGSKPWTTIQILAPVIVGTSIIALAVIFFIYWRRYRRQASRTGTNPAFIVYVRKLFTGRAPSIRHETPSDQWRIDDEEHHTVNNETDGETESFFMVSHPHSVVESPVEVSHWSPTTGGMSSPPDGPPRLSFNRPHRPSRLNPIEQRMPYTSTMRKIGDRVKSILPWVHRPIPVNNIGHRPGYRIDGGRSSRSNTSSTMETRKGNDRYQTISEADEEEVDAIGTGRTRNPGMSGIIVGARDDERSVITGEDRDAVAGSVIIIGNRDISVESGSTGAHGTPVRPTPRTGGAAMHPRRGMTVPESAVTPSVNFQVEPPSPTLESFSASPRVIPPSPGAPPLLPPPPQERPPLPPVTIRSTPRRTPSPRLRIETQLQDATSHRPAGTTANQQHPYHQRDRSGSGSNTNSLSYASLHNPNAHRHSQSFPDPNDLLATEAIDASTGRPSGSGSRPRPQHPSGPAPQTIPPQLTHQHSDTSMGQFSILHTPKPDHRRLSSGDTSQSEFDPYVTSGLPRPFIMQPNRRPDAEAPYYPANHHHNRSTSSTSINLPRTPGEVIGVDGSGLHQLRGWSADDDAASLLMQREPMTVDDDGFGRGSGVYLAAPREANAMSGHVRNLSAESFTTAASDFGTTERLGGGRRSARQSVAGELSPTISMLEADLRRPPGFASYAGSVDGSSGWDASTYHSHGFDISPADAPPLPVLRNPNLAPNRVLSPNHTPTRTLTPNPNASPQIGGHARLGSDVGSSRRLNLSRSRENIIVPARNDPINLFPASVRSQGYTTGLGPDAIPVPPRSPRLNANGNGNGNGNGHSTAGGNDGGQRNSFLTGTGAFAGYVERDRTQTGGGTWGTDSSGVMSVFEPVQQLPEAAPPPSSKRTP